MQKKKMICIAFPKWEGNYLKSTVQMMKCLAKEYDVLYVDYTFSWADIIYSILGKKYIPVKHILGWKNRVSKIQLDDNCSIDVLRLPPIIPCNWIRNDRIYQFISSFNARYLLFFLQKVIQKLHFSDSIVVNAFQPWLGYFWNGKLDESKVIYYCYDEISAAPWIKKHGSKMENEFMKLADYTIVTSDHLLRTKSKISPNISVVKNGVDTSVFSVEYDDKLLLDDNLTGFTHTIGYLGSIDERIDLELLINLISTCKQYLFKFVGRVTDPKIQNRLSKFDNVEFKGPLQPSELPVQVDCMDICLIPFKINKLTASIYPLKINEYLLRGKPVVSTPFADLSDFQSMISIAKDGPSFSKCIEQLLTQGSSLNDIQKRKDFARSNSWKSRAHEFSEIIEKLAS
tara:strand:- start:943 stop:2142 length:1200 start_codon:yes stop_codon:yes gene_type:complete